MNPLTLVKRIQSINAKEADLGISEQASWHAKYKDSAYVFTGGLPYDLTEGDLLAVFAQYGEVVDVNLVRDRATGKSKGYAFLAYEDQRSTTLAVDNLNGGQIAGRTIRVDHVSNYKKKQEEDEEITRQKREERGVCRAFQRGECKYGDACRFSHNEQRAADTGWGPEEDRKAKSALDNSGYRGPERNQDALNDGKASRGKDNTDASWKRKEAAFKDLDHTDRGKRSEQKEDRDKHDRRSSRSELKSRDDYDERKRSRRHETEFSARENRDGRDRERDWGKDRERDGGKDREREGGKDRDRDREREKMSSKVRDSSPQRQKDRKDDDLRRGRRDDDYHRSRR